MTRRHGFTRLNLQAYILHGKSVLDRSSMLGELTIHRKANAIGRSSKTVREFLERNHKDEMDREDTIKLTVKSLREVVQTGAKNIEIAIMAPGKSVEMLPVEAIESYVKNIETEKQEEAAKKKGSRAPGTGTAAILTRGGETSES